MELEVRTLPKQHFEDSIRLFQRLQRVVRRRGAHMRLAFFQIVSHRGGALAPEVHLVRKLLRLLLELYRLRELALEKREPREQVQHHRLGLRVFKRLAVLECTLEEHARGDEVALLNLEMRLLHPDLVARERLEHLDVLGVALLHVAPR
eukprot:07708_1